MRNTFKFTTKLLAHAAVARSADSPSAGSPAARLPQGRKLSGPRPTADEFGARAIVELRSLAARRFDCQ